MKKLWKNSQKKIISFLCFSQPLCQRCTRGGRYCAGSIDPPVGKQKALSGHHLFTKFRIYYDPESVFKSDPESQTFKSTLSSPARRRGKQFFQHSRRGRSNRLLFNAINTLAPQSAAIIQLSLQGLKNEEIARELSISENTVKVLKYRSLKKLRQLLHHRIFNILAFYI